MNKKVEVTINVPTDARSRNNTPFVEHTKFTSYCKANKVRINRYSLEGYEKKGLLRPCVRVLYPRELLRRKFRIENPPYRKYYNIRAEWEPLTNMEDSISRSQHGVFEECTESIDYGHPLERELEENQPFVLSPAKHRFKAWDRYKVTVGEISGTKIRRSRAKHYYSSWKIFFLEDLNNLNIDEHNRATGSIRGEGVVNNNPQHTTLEEFIPFFRTTASFAYRRQMSFLNYRYNTKKRQRDWNDILKRNKQIARKLFSDFDYPKYVRFLRKLIELHEQYMNKEKILLSLEIESYLRRTLLFLRAATNYKFQRICDDVSGPVKFSLGVGYIDKVSVYSGKLEEIFADEKWDLEKNVRWIFDHDLTRFNASLLDEEKLPDSLAEELFNELAEEPSLTAIAAIRKINKAYQEPRLWRDDVIWGGIRDLAVSIEEHGRNWIGGKSLDGVFKKAFASEYQELRKKTKGHTPDAKDNKEYLSKLKFFESNRYLPKDKKCGHHLLVAYLTRNFSSHGKGLSGDKLQKNLASIYSSLVNTLFVIYAEYLKNDLSQAG